MRNKIKSRKISGGVYSFLRMVFLNVEILLSVNLVKMQIPPMIVWVSHSFLILFRDKRSLRFSALTSVGAFFVLWGIFVYSCTFIGHSNCDNDIKERLYSEIKTLIQCHNVTRFYVGTHGKFDVYTYQTLCKLEKVYDIDVLVVLSRLGSIPISFEGANTIYPEILDKTPHKYRIIKRNHYMIDKSQFMICYINHTFSNTYNFVKRAVDKKLNIINLGKFDLGYLRMT